MENYKLSFSCHQIPSLSVSLLFSKLKPILTHLIWNFRVNEQEHVPKQKILRNSHYTQQQVYEEDIRMPTQLPPDVQRQTIKERIKVGIIDHINE